MFFIPTDQQNCTILKCILTLYEEASGQRINTDKSSLSFAAKTTSRVRNEIKRTLGITKEGGVGKYLGLPEHFGRRKKDLFHSIVNKIKIKAAALSTRFLSSAGKLTLLKAVLSAIPSFAMTCFPLPVGICNMIQSALTRFWWDSNTGKKKMCWLSWDKLTKPKGMGGLGFKDIQTFNTALLAKLPWRMLTNPNCLLSRVLLGKYCHKSPLLKVQLAKGASHGWTGILAGRDLLVSHLGRAVGEGTEIKVWTDSWISTSNRVIPHGPLREGDSDLFVSDLITRGACEWNKELINKIMPGFTEAILELKPSKTGAKDSYIWYPSKTGIYSTKSGYAAAVAMQEQDHTSANIPSTFNWYKSVWSISTAPKIQLFIWKAINGALPTGENLQKRGLMQNTLCVHCGLTETTEHLLLHCSFARQVWNLIPLTSPIEPDDFPQIISAVGAATSWLCLPPCGVSGDIFSWVVWNLWITRNQLLFEARPASASTTALKALMGAREWTQAQEPPPKVTKNTQIQGRPDSLPTGTVACNTDAAWRKESLDAGLAWIFDSSTALIVSDGCKFQARVSSVLMAEGLAVREALSHALHIGISKIWLRSDSLSLIKAINSVSKPMNLYGVLSDIECLSASFEFCCFSFVPREENGPADNLSKACLYHAATTWA